MAVPGVRSVGMGEHAAVRGVDVRPAVLRGGRRGASRREPAAKRRLSDREPGLLPDARPADRRPDGISTSATPATDRRSASSTKRSSAITCRAGRRSAPGSRHGRQPRRRRRSSSARSSASRGRSRDVPTKPRTCCRSTCRWRRTRSTTSSCSSAPATGRGDALAAPVRAAIGRVDKDQLVGAALHDDPRRRGLGGHRPPSLPGGARGDLRRAGAAARHGRHLRRARLLGPAARARLRRAARARRHLHATCCAWSSSAPPA